MTTVNVLIVEDDPFFSSMLTDLFAAHFPHILVHHIANSIAEARQFLLKQPVDLVFLDIELPDGKGFDLLISMDEIDFEVIVTTSHSAYMLDAIRHSALDYLIKPVGLPEMEVAMAKFMKRFQSERTDIQSQPAAKPDLRKIPLPTLDGFVFVNLDEIIFAEADRSYSLFSLKSGKKIMVSKTLGDFEERLVKHNFFRIHKSYIINLHEIINYVRGEGGHLVMTNKAVVPVSRTRKIEFLKIFGY
jgi:two-component system LytT family response regulator